MNSTEKINLDSTEYDIDKISNYDFRFESGKKDCLFLHSLGFICILIATIFMYVFGSSDPATMKYFLGFPVWVSGTILIYLFMFVIGVVYILKWEAFPFTAKYRKGNDK